MWVRDVWCNVSVWPTSRHEVHMFTCQSQQSAAEMAEALQTVDGDNNDLTRYSPHLVPCHFLLNPRLVRFLGQGPVTLADIKCKRMARLHTTPKNAAHECSQACPNYWKERLRFKYVKSYRWILKTFWETGHTDMEAALEESHINESSPHAVSKKNTGFHTKSTV